jgi:malonate-semialdehyde dehydrogenase (acetylating)/methylmalonate-semialdehyde dehydrogenase
MRTITHWIDGKPWDGAPARTAEVFDPSTGAVASRVALAGPAEIEVALRSAASA